MKNKLVIIDGSNMAYRAYFTQNHLSHRGQSVGLIFGVPWMVRNLIHTLRPSKVIVVWDGKKSKVRKSIHPEYKAKRTTKDRMDFGDFIKQRDITQKILYSLGIPQVHHPEAEADDMIYRLVRKHHKDHSITIASNDKDFLQLVASHDVTVFMDKPSTGIMEITKKNFEEWLEVPHDRFLDFLMVGGDDSDNIKGLPGHGPVNTKKWLERYNSIDHYMQSPDANPNHIEILQKNQILIDLKKHYLIEKENESLPKIQYFKDKSPKLNKDRFLRWAYKFNISTFENKSFILAFKHLQR